MVQKIDLKHMPTKSRAWIEVESPKLARGCLGGSEIQYVAISRLRQKYTGTLEGCRYCAATVAVDQRRLNGASGVGARLSPRVRAARNQPPARQYLLAGVGTRSSYGARMMPQCSQWLCWLGGLVRLGQNIEWAEVKEYGWARHHRRGAVGPTARMQN
jgi:hypothetical protein